MVVTLLVLGKPVQVALCWSWQLAGFNLALNGLHLSGFNPVQVRTRMPGSCYRLSLDFWQLPSFPQNQKAELGLVRPPSRGTV